MKTCFNHPQREAVSVCHVCGKYYCAECLDEGIEFYYCKNPHCQELFQADKLPENLQCPNCNAHLDPEEDERLSRKIHCPQCDALIDYKMNPPVILNKENFVELLSSFNQGDIALIKSILDDSDIEYYISGENFLGVEPLVQPAQFFVNQNQITDAKELLKDLDLNIWGVSRNNED